MQRLFSVQVDSLPDSPDELGNAEVRRNKILVLINIVNRRGRVLLDNYRYPVLILLFDISRVIQSLVKAVLLFKPELHFNVQYKVMYFQYIGALSICSVQTRQHGTSCRDRRACTHTHTRTVTGCIEVPPWRTGGSENQ